MKNLSELLERFTKSLGKDTFVRNSIIDSIENIVSIKISLDEISVKEGVLEISSTPGKNNAIRLKESQIIDSLKNERGIRISRIFYK